MKTIKFLTGTLILLAVMFTACDKAEVEELEKKDKKTENIERRFKEDYDDEPHRPPFEEKEPFKFLPENPSRESA